MMQEPNEILPERPQETEDEWALNVPSLHVPIMPDDSASNIDFSRHRRRHERVSSSSGLERGSSRRSERGERESRVEGGSRSGSKRERKESKLGIRDSRREREFGGTVLESIAGSEAGETTQSGKNRRKKKRDGERDRSRVDGEDDEERRRRRREKEKERDRDGRDGKEYRDRREKSEKEREGKGEKGS